MSRTVFAARLLPCALFAFFALVLGTCGCARSQESQPAAARSEIGTPKAEGSTEVALADAGAVRWSTAGIPASEARRGDKPSGLLPYWSRFHGEDFTNISKEVGLLKEWPADGPPLLWRATGIGEGYSSVTLADGRIFTAGDIDQRCMVTALDLDGRILWQADNGRAWTGDYPGSRGTPTIDGPRVYHESAHGQVTCYEAASGRKVWSVNILERFQARNIQWALAESVLIDGDKLICCPGGPKTSIVALDKMTGETIWAAPSTGDSASYASPSIGVFKGRRIVFTMNAKAVIGVDADSGKLLFRYPHTTMYDVNALMPIYHEGCVFISTGYGSGSVLLELQEEGGEVSVRRRWASKDLDNHHGGVILLDGYLYGSAHGGRWVCLDWATGRASYSSSGVGKGSLTAAEGMLYVFSERGQVGLVPADPAEHRVVSRFRMPSGGSGPYWAHPVVCGGRLYLRHSDTLFAYDIREKTVP